VRVTDQWLHEASVRLVDEVVGVALDNPDLIGVEALNRVRAPDTPPAGIFGAGLFGSGDADKYIPALFVMQELVGLKPSDSIEVIDPHGSEPAVILFQRLAIDPPPGGVVVALPVPHELGTKVHSDMAGTLGVPVWLSDGREGVLTAGHVARTIGAQPTSNGTPIGVVTHSHHRHLYRSPTTTADVAAIALNQTGLGFVQKPPFSAVGQARKLDRAWAFNASGTSPNGELVRSFHQDFALDDKGEWKDVAMVDAAISIDGDSGSAVMDSEGNLIGHIVGGHPMAYSLVQNIDVLLSDSKARVRL